MNKIKIRRIAMLLAVLGLIAVLFAGCAQKNDNVEDNNVLNSETEKVEDNYPIEIEDEFGNKVTIEKEPMKIVSLAPHNTEVLFALGLGDRIVGVTSYCDYPEEALTKEKVGDFNGGNLERIIELNPDLVLLYGAGNEEENKVLKEAGIKILGFMPESIEAVMKDIEIIGKATGKDKEADNLINEMKEKRDYILDKVKDQEKVRVFYEIWHDPLMAAGPGSFMDELITLAGGDNIAKDAKGAYPEFDLEQLIERNPEVYLTAEDLEEKTIDSIKSRPGYENITAVKNNKVYLLEPNIVSRPGPRIVEALEMLAKCLHSELFD